MTTPRLISRALRGLRHRRAPMLAVTATVVTVLALIQVPVCGMEMEACVLMTGAAPATTESGIATGAACPLTGDAGGMECCVGDSHSQPVQPEGTDAQSQQAHKQLQAPALESGCTGECIPCDPDGTPRSTESEDGAIPDVPLYTLFSSYLS